MHFRLFLLVIALSSILITLNSTYAFDINSFASGIQQKNTPEQWIKKNQIPNYDESYLNQGNLSGYEDQQKAQKFMDLAAQMLQSQYTYTCSMIRKVEDKTFFQCNVDGSIYPSIDICTANCKSIYACNQEQCLYQNMCSAFQTCPLGDYACVNNSCTQTGTCSSTQVTTTQYQCPTTGQTYSDQTTCNNNCVQTASCNPASLSFSGGGQSNCCWRVDNIDITGSGGILTIPVIVTVNEDGSTGISGAFFSTPGVSFSGSAHIDFVWDNGNSRLVGNGNKIDVYDYYGYKGSINVYGATVSGSLLLYNPSRSYYSLYSSGNTIRNGADGNYLTFTSTTYTCPLGSQYSCSGSPPTCTAGTTCVTQNVTATKYQCSLTGTQYDTESQCTSACLNTASCNTNYKCTYENSIYSDPSTCQANCSFYQCPSDGAYYLTAPECQNACASFICQRDGTKFTSMYDCQLNCKEAGVCTAQ
jgi:hypothetical protein